MKGCLTVVAGFVVICVLVRIYSCVTGDVGERVAIHRERMAAERERMAAEETKARKNKAAERERFAKEMAAHDLAQREASRESKLRAFAIKNADGLWRTYQMIKGQIDEHDKRIDELKTAFFEFGRNPDEDADYRRICGLRDEMVRSCQLMRGKIEDAYLASVKFEATPGKREYSETMAKALEDGVREAERAERRFKEMKDRK